MYTKRLMQVLLVGTIILLSGCSSLEITATDSGDTTTSVSGLSIDAEVSFSPDNPDPETSIDFQVPEAGWVRLEVMNVTGHRVALLFDEEVPAGHFTVPWDATNDDGDRIQSGIYFYRLTCGQGTIMKPAIYCTTPEECEDLIDGI